MNENRLPDYLEHMRQAASTALPQLLEQLRNIVAGKPAKG